VFLISRPAPRLQSGIIVPGAEILSQIRSGSQRKSQSPVLVLAMNATDYLLLIRDNIPNVIAYIMIVEPAA
jgi:hypothetical protein